MERKPNMLPICVARTQFSLHRGRGGSVHNQYENGSAVHSKCRREVIFPAFISRCFRSIIPTILWHLLVFHFCVLAPIGGCRTATHVGLQTSANQWSFFLIANKVNTSFNQRVCLSAGVLLLFTLFVIDLKVSGIIFFSLCVWENRRAEARITKCQVKCAVIRREFTVRCPVHGKCRFGWILSPISPRNLHFYATICLNCWS